MAKKRGQITAFIFVGIVIFIIFGILFFIASEIRMSKLKAEAEQRLDYMLKTTAIEYYVSLCVKDSVKQGLDLIGKQGGYIKKSQGGIVDDNHINFIEFNGYNVSYIDVRNLTDISPNYPCPLTGFLCGGPGIAPYYCKFVFGVNQNCVFGVNRLPSLDNSNDEYSIKKQLEAYIANRTKKCVQFNQITEFEPIFNFSEGNVTANVTISENNVYVNVRYPIVVSIRNRELTRRVLNFYDSKNIRLKWIYYVASRLINDDLKNLDYDIIINGSRWINRYIRPVMGLRINKEGTTDIIIINDSFSVLDGKPYIFQFARQNHIPALDYIPKTGPQTNDYDVIALENTTLRIDPVARDVDEDHLEYHYHGWKAEYEQIYNITNISGNPVIGCVLNYSDLNLCSNTNYSCLYGKNPCHNFVNQWENSSLYKLTNRSAEINLTSKDVGPHNVTLKVFDGQFYDWQIIRIFVDRIIRPVISSCNFYNISCNISSIEDPYKLDSSLTTGSLLNPNMTFTWRDLNEGWNFTTTSLCILLPTFLECGKDVDITNMTGPFNNVGIHTIQLTATTYSSSASVTKDINVTQCIPYRSNSYPFPYNSSNPFFSNHTCCNDDFTFASNSKVCYNRTQYGVYVNGSYNSFNDNIFIQVNGYPSVNNRVYNDNINDTTANDIWKREFKRNCSGNRGNICVGNATSVFSVYKRCNDERFGTGERCSGPPKDYLKQKILSNSPLNCVNYKDETFESIIGKGTGVCNNTRACDGSILIYNFTCDGNGGCKKMKDWFDCSRLDGYNTTDCEFRGEKLGNVCWHDYTCFSLPSPHCYYIPVDLDNSESLCGGYGNWTKNSTGGSEICCGDDYPEFTIESKYSASIDSSVTETESCCNNSNDCVNNSICYPPGNKIDVDSDSDKDVCLNGTWYDCESDSDCVCDGYPNCICSSNDCKTKTDVGSNSYISDCIGTVKTRVGSGGYTFGCCNANQCWNGTNCVDNESTKWINVGSKKEVWVCCNGNWEIGDSCGISA